VNEVANMIDTITLIIKPPFFKITDGSVFTPHIDELRKQRFGRHPMLRAVLNPLKTGYKRVYLPFLTFTLRASENHIEEELRVEFSAPKMLFLENVQEVDEKDFGLLTQRLKEKLEGTGIFFPPDYLPHAEVSKIHFCKNIVLDNFISANYVISKLARFDVPKSLDFNQKRFDNSGRALYLYSKTHHFVIYDKVFDLNRPGNRGVDRDKTLFQKSLFDYLQKEKEPLEILRLEVRLTQKQKLASILKKSGVVLDTPRFKSLFKKEISRKVIMFYWNNCFRDTKYRFLLSQSKKSDDLVNDIFNYLKHDSNQTKSKIIQYKIAFSLLGFYLYAQQNGVRSLRNVIERSFNKRTWFRANKDFEMLSKALENNKKEDFMSRIEEALEKFETYKPNFRLDYVNESILK